MHHAHNSLRSLPCRHLLPLVLGQTPFCSQIPLPPVTFLLSYLGLSQSRWMLFNTSLVEKMFSCGYQLDTVNLVCYELLPFVMAYKKGKHDYSTVLVVSPLVLFMVDQVTNLQQRGVCSGWHFRWSFSCQ